MIQTTYTVKSKDGLHARPASLLTKLASEFDGEVDLSYKDKTVTMKSIMAVMSLGIPHNATFTITVDGDGENAHKEKLELLLREHEII
ncbi:MAG: HPr family phosphocarrier protein [Candidatus Izemoplasmataceae bacterium]